MGKKNLMTLLLLTLSLMFFIFAPSFLLTSEAQSGGNRSRAESFKEKKKALIMDNIYNDILKIKDKYKELQDFEQKNYKKESCFIRHLYGKWLSPVMLAPGSIWFHIAWSGGVCSRDTCDKSPNLESYNKELSLYLTLFFRANPENIGLENEIIEIIKKNNIEFQK